MDDERILLKKLFKDECDNSSKKRRIEELKWRVYFERRKLDLSIFTFDEPLNNQSFENWVEVNMTKGKGQG